MPDNIFPRAGFRMSEATLRKNMGLSPLYEFLRMYASDDRVVLNNIPGINNFPIAMGAYWTPANSGGASAANFASVVGAGPGYIEGDTGTTDDGSISLIGPVVYQGDLNVGAMFDIQIDDPTEYILEVGFAAAVPGSNAPVVTDVDTPNVVADTAVLAIDTSQTITTLAFATAGSTGGMDDKATTIAQPITNFTAATRHRIVIQTLGNFAYCAIDGVVAAVHDASVDAGGCIEGGTLIAPWIYCATRESGVARFVRMYNFAIWQDWR
jgi:hypothetical protein